MQRQPKPKQPLETSSIKRVKCQIPRRKLKLLHPSSITHASTSSLRLVRSHDIITWPWKTYRTPACECDGRHEFSVATADEIGAFLFLTIHGGSLCKCLGEKDFSMIVREISQHLAGLPVHSPSPILQAQLQENLPRIPYYPSLTTSGAGRYSPPSLLPLSLASHLHHLLHFSSPPASPSAILYSDVTLLCFSVAVPEHAHHNTTRANLSPCSKPLAPGEYAMQLV